jgi:hypothetical protein
LPAYLLPPGRYHGGVAHEAPIGGGKPPQRRNSRADIARVKPIYSIILLAAACEVAAAQAVPLPRPRPPEAAPAADASRPEEPPPPSACRLRLTPALAVAPSLAPLTGPNECGAEDVVQLEAVLLPDKTRVAVTPPAILRCSFAEAIVQWVREDLAPAARELGAPLKSLDNYASYDCRGRNRVIGAKLSEHGKANALDVRSLRLANGQVVGLTDPHVGKDFRETLRKATYGAGPGLGRLSREPRARGPGRAQTRAPHVPVGGARTRR